MEPTKMQVLTSFVDDSFDSLLCTRGLFLGVILLLVYTCWRSFCPSLSPREPLPPGQDGWPFIGETFRLASEKANFFRKRRSMFGSVYRTHLFGCPAVRVTGDEIIREVIKLEGQKIHSYYPFTVRRLFGDNSIVTLSGSKHRLRKRQLSQTLSHEYLQEHVQCFSAVASRHLDSWCTQEVIDIYPACKSISVETALLYLLGVDVTSSQLDEIRYLLTIFTDNLFCFPLYFPGTSYYKACSAKKRIMNTIKDLRKIQSHITKNLGTATTEVDGYEGLEELFELLFVGSDNTGSSMFIITNLLARHPHVLERARAELEGAGLVGERGGPHPKLSLEQVRDLPYIRAIVREGLRLMPPVGGVYRTVTEEFTINVYDCCRAEIALGSVPNGTGSKGYRIPRGWRVIAGIRETHENDSGLNEPQRFDPDRWLNGHAKPTFLSFGSGTRMCPGKTYADVLLCVFVVELVRRGKLHIATDSPLSMFPAVKPIDRILMTLR